MAPLAAEADLRTSTAYAASLIIARSGDHDHVDPLSKKYLVRRLAPTGTANPNLHPGLGARPPQSFNNKALFGLFGILGAVMVLVSIWFFFWAKNGGFVWRKGDWDDYKSTVLRRKGPDGKTLSNATKSTKLGNKSVAGTFDYEREKQEMTETHDFGYSRGSRSDEKPKKKSRSGKTEGPTDDDLRAYRHEKPAKVGGLNREHDGSHIDYTSTDPSVIMSLNSDPPKKSFLKSKTYKIGSPAEIRKHEEKEDRKREKQAKKDAAKAVKSASKAGSIISPRKPEPKKQSSTPTKPNHKAQESTDRLISRSGDREAEHAARRERRTSRQRQRSTSRNPDRSSRMTVQDDNDDLLSSLNPSELSDRYSALSGSSISAFNARPVSEHDSFYDDNFRPPQAPAFASRHSSPHRHSGAAAAASGSSSRQSSPKKNATRFPPTSYRNDPFTSTPAAPASDAGTFMTEESGTRSYQHVMSNTRTPTAPSTGYRRGGRGRRDSLDSDGDIESRLY